MIETNIDLHFADSIGREHVLHATASGSGWRLRASLDGCTFNKHFSCWQSVERFVVLLRHRASRPPVSEATPPRHLSTAA